MTTANDAGKAESRTVAIIGCGKMGCDIAALFLASGWQVEAVAPNEKKWEPRIQRIARSMTQLDRTLDHHKLRFMSQTSDVDWACVHLAIETIPEKFDLKRALFEELDALAPKQIPVATNTSGFRISEIAANCATSDRMAGLHFFLPAHLVPAVEVVRGEKTDQDVVEKLRDMILSVGHVPIMVARDVPGFLANRIQHALMREAFAAIDEGLGTPEDVDAAVKFGFGFRYVAAGPILQKEFAGLDTQLAAASVIYPSLSKSSEPSDILQRLVDEGRYGMKAGHGFRKWSDQEIADEHDRYEQTLIAATRLLRRSLPPAEDATVQGDGFKRDSS